MAPVPAEGDEAASPNHTSNVDGDLPLHAPKASTPAVVAKKQISTVTRTDSVQAAAMGIGKPQSEAEESDHSYRPPSARANHGRPPSTLSQERPGSTSQAESIQEGEQEHGIPAIGLQVPMYPNAGDVQAPSPANVAPGSATGIGFFNDGRPQSQHGRRRSHHAFPRPPDSYGLHGHGVTPADNFEKAWYEKHPDEAVKEESGAYGPGVSSVRGEWALSSEDLNRLVRGTGKSGAGFGMADSNFRWSPADLTQAPSQV
jgi:hypothetical protein